MELRITFTMTVSGTGDSPAALASALGRRLAGSTGGRYNSPGEMVAYVLEHEAEGLSDAPGHALASVRLCDTAVEVLRP